MCIDISIINFLTFCVKHKHNTLNTLNRGRLVKWSKDLNPRGTFGKRRDLRYLRYSLLFRPNTNTNMGSSPDNILFDWNNRYVFLVYYSHHLTITEVSEEGIFAITNGLVNESLTVSETLVNAVVFVVHDNFHTVAHLYMATHYFPECE